MKYICTLCNFVLEEGISSSADKAINFESLPEQWVCPQCSAQKDYFQPCSCASLPLYEATKVVTTQDQIEAA